MDVVNAEQARIAEEAGACAVMALERVPADIRKDGFISFHFIFYLKLNLFSFLILVLSNFLLFH